VLTVSGKSWLVKSDYVRVEICSRGSLNIISPQTRTKEPELQVLRRASVRSGASASTSLGTVYSESYVKAGKFTPEEYAKHPVN
jgi:hypothetical protein